MEEILKALEGLLPEDSKEVAEAVEKLIETRVAEVEESIKKDYEEKLEEGYKTLSEELEKAEANAEAGFMEAAASIHDMKVRQERMVEEFQSFLDEQYSEAAGLIKLEQEKNSTLEVEINEAYEKKYEELREWFTEKIHEFLQDEGQTIYENAKRDILSDPRFVEHRLTLNRIIESVSDYISDEDYASVVNQKLEETSRQIEDLNVKLRNSESRNMRISTENTKLSETVRKSTDLLKEQAALLESSRLNETNERVKNVTGKGNRVVQEGVIVEENNNTQKGSNTNNQIIPEGYDENALKELQALAGIKS